MFIQVSFSLPRSRPVFGTEHVGYGSIIDLMVVFLRRSQHHNESLFFSVQVGLVWDVRVVGSGLCGLFILLLCVHRGSARTRSGGDSTVACTASWVLVRGSLAVVLLA